MKEDVVEEETLLWKSFLRGDDEAFSELYKRYIQVFFLYGLQFTSDRELIKDCIQDVFEKLLKTRKKLGSTNNVRIYLFVIMKNAMINMLKKEGHTVCFVGNEEQTQYEEKTIVDELVEKEDEYRIHMQINKIFSLLTSRQKEIMYYRYIECRDIKEIATIADMNYQSVLNLIHRSVKKVREGIDL